MIVADASPLIILARIGHLDTLFTIMGELHVPDEVIREVTEAGHRPGRDEVLAAVSAGRIRAMPAPPALTRRLEARLDPGEAAAIALAMMLDEPLLIDERKGRAVAVEMGVVVIGTLGLIDRAARAGHITDLPAVLDALDRAGFRMSPALRELVGRAT